MENMIIMVEIVQDAIPVDAIIIDGKIIEL